MGLRAERAQGWTLSEGKGVHTRALLHGLVLPFGVASREKELADRQAETVLEGLGASVLIPICGRGTKMVRVRHLLELFRPLETNTKQQNLECPALCGRDVLASGGLCCPPLRAAQLAAHVVPSCC